MTGIVAAIPAKIAATAVFSRASDFFGKIPSWLWIALAGAVIAFTGVLWHTHEVKLTIAHAKQEQRQIDDAAWKQALDREHQAAMTWKAGFDKQTAATVADERKLNDQAIANNAAVARALSLHGPGRASASGCRQGDYSRPSTAASGHQQGASSASTAASQVPSGDGAIVPWNWLIKVLQEHDDMRADLQAIYYNDKKQRANWPGK